MDEEQAITPALGVLIQLNIWKSEHFLPNRLFIFSGFLALMGFVGLCYRGRLVTAASTRRINLLGAAAQNLGGCICGVRWQGSP